MLPFNSVIFTGTEIRGVAKGGHLLSGQAVQANRAAEGALRDVASKEGWTVKAVAG